MMRALIMGIGLIAGATIGASPALASLGDTSTAVTRGCGPCDDDGPSVDHSTEINIYNNGDNSDNSRYGDNGVYGDRGYYYGDRGYYYGGGGHWGKSGTTASSWTG